MSFTIGVTSNSLLKSLYESWKMLFIAPILTQFLKIQYNFQDSFP